MRIDPIEQMRRCVTGRRDNMTDYRRSRFCGGYYFFTVVTYRRRRFLVDDLARACLRAAWQRVREVRPFEVVALCLLPDHLHCVWRLPEGDNEFSIRWMLIRRDSRVVISRLAGAR
jgi:putative transposase